MVFLEALRQFQFTVGRENIVFVHVSLVPVLGSVGEQKTKPTQHSVKVREWGKGEKRKNVAHDCILRCMVCEF